MWEQAEPSKSDRHCGNQHCFQPGVPRRRNWFDHEARRTSGGSLHLPSLGEARSAAEIRKAVKGIDILTDQCLDMH